ncbi:sugar kinase [Biformimicrobium ophioploci]|uniref:Sugar kinase n=2 Tax=Biformimicrobium ophioploci TaxID=3036711 RepID=A0ABQ6LUV3_9GAMM|nr:sugar kinase [Microbulbifer sp. NKW57]
MLEVNRGTGIASGNQLPATLAYGGDTLNTSVYLARYGVAVDYATALGDDPLSDWMIEQWQMEGVGCGLVARMPGEVPGLYMIEVDEHGERTFHYWRDSAPARRLLDAPGADALLKAMLRSDYLYLSGITLGIYAPTARQRLYSFLEAYRSKGGRVIFDGNYRPRLWESEGIARTTYEQMYRLTDIALPTIEDEQQVFGDADAASIIARLQGYGVGEVVLKMGGDGCLVADADSRVLVPAEPVDVVDTTAAGDSFNAGYLAARIAGDAPVQAAAEGHKMAAQVIQHRGAIIPPAKLPGWRPPV